MHGIVTSKLQCSSNTHLYWWVLKIQLILSFSKHREHLLYINVLHSFCCCCSLNSSSDHKPRVNLQENIFFLTHHSPDKTFKEWYDDIHLMCYYWWKTLKFWNISFKLDNIQNEYQVLQSLQLFQFLIQNMCINMEFLISWTIIYSDWSGDIFPQNTMNPLCTYQFRKLFV